MSIRVEIEKEKQQFYCLCGYWLQALELHKKIVFFLLSGSLIVAIFAFDNFGFLQNTYLNAVYCVECHKQAQQPVPLLLVFLI